MVKNKLEKELSSAIRAEPLIWGMKLQNNPLAHTNTPGDFILDYYKGELELNLVLIECKQVSWKDGKPQRLAFKRLKQQHDLLAFNSFRKYHQSYYLIAYLDKTFFDKADVYLVPVMKMSECIENHLNVSLNRTDAKEMLKSYKIKLNLELLEKLKQGG